MKAIKDFLRVDSLLTAICYAIVISALFILIIELLF